MKRLEGVYLVIDPKRNWESLFQKLDGALKGGLSIVQVWNHWPENIPMEKKLEFLNKIKTYCVSFDVPVLMHDDWELADLAGLEGVHFDEIPNRFGEAQRTLKGKTIGITVGNDLDKIRWAEEQNIDYISFCAVFPSPSVDSCEIVSQKNIRMARTITEMPIFLSGGIQITNLKYLNKLDFDGVAIISGILDGANPAKAVQEYILELQKIKTP
ncbi:thiamine phosphate synthase [Muricauda sp. SCSIO 64092]|uniref:thiamine phosphate synthase n=1 Tax=Allomuricauda sp. SCSIO 64092 TaxID=2908842 RepID=UPI001FF3A705|nr:thiamine phosphate synthase [Muricauda sp. SCSIO 64092]UOY08087.1 thiamine phosphate synthase [Muricauda sp. SCSIO 64092]